MINSRPETYVPTVEGCVDPKLASTVTYGLTVKTMFMEDKLTRLRGIAKERIQFDRTPGQGCQTTHVLQYSCPIMG